MDTTELPSRGAAARQAPACAACLSTETAPHLVKNGFGFSRCAACGFLFADPMPSEAVVDAYYAENYRSANADFYPKARSRLRRARVKALRLLPRIRGKDVLDLGCGGGFMADSFRFWGARASGLDISSGGIAYAKAHFPGCTFYCEAMESFAKRGITFDFVFTTELFEHLRGVGEVMPFLRDVVRPGGSVFVATPDIGHPAVPADLPSWDQIAPPEHLQIFTEAAASALFARFGFTLDKRWPKHTPALAHFFKRNG